MKKVGTSGQWRFLTAGPRSRQTRGGHATKVIVTLPPFQPPLHHLQSPARGLPLDPPFSRPHCTGGISFLPHRRSPRRHKASRPSSFPKRSLTPLQHSQPRLATIFPSPAHTSPRTGRLPCSSTAMATGTPIFVYVSSKFPLPFNSVLKAMKQPPVDRTSCLHRSSPESSSKAAGVTHLVDEDLLPGIPEPHLLHVAILQPEVKLLLLNPTLLTACAVRAIAEVLPCCHRHRRQSATPCACSLSHGQHVGVDVEPAMLQSVPQRGRW